jgi:SAM-dependent methyltransferase
VGTKTTTGREWITGGASYYEYQYSVGERVVGPWLRERMVIAGKAVADFGAHGGGMLDALRAAGAASGVGLEINPAIVESSPFQPSDGFRLEVADLTALGPDGEKYDLVVLHDVLEHVPAAAAVLAAAERSLAPGGRVFVSFPPYYSMVGGHQHLARGWARAVPWVHYLPERAFVRLARPSDNEYMSARDSLDDMLSVRRTRLTLRKAERAFARAGLVVADSDLFVSRPEYTVRYGWPTVRAGVLGRLPAVREALVNGAFYLLAAAGAAGGT